MIARKRFGSRGLRLVACIVGRIVHCGEGLRRLRGAQLRADRVHMARLRS